MPRPHGSPKQLEQRRLRAWKLLQEGFTPVEVARKLGVNRRSVRRWRALGERQQLAARPASGRPPKLTERQREQLVGRLIAGPLACGYATELWTCPRIAEVIRKRYKVRYHAAHVSRLLRGLGFTPQKLERQARERDEEAIRGWVRATWPRVKNTPSG